MHLRKDILFILFFLFVSGVSAAQDVEPFQEGERVVFVGNRIPFTEEFNREIFKVSGLKEFTIANILQSNMVIQQARPFRLWGTAPEGNTIIIQADWTDQNVKVQADMQGKWTGEIPVPNAEPGNFAPHTITVNHKKNEITLTNILIGEVWLCAGQSNMDMPVDSLPFMTYPGVPNFKEEIADADYPAIRLYKTEADFKLQPIFDTEGSWKITSPETVGSFSGVAYFFGRELFQELNIPIGLVVSAASGASGQAFTRKEVLETNPKLKNKYLDPYEDAFKSQTAVDTTGFFAKVTHPSLIYNAMIHPLTNLSIRGYTWYQGESNHRDGKMYTRLATAMLEDWRKSFNQGDLPFYFVQMTPYRENEEDADATWYALFREAQEDMLKVKNTGMAVTMDVGEVDNIHPRDKKSVGVRLAKIALYKTYNYADVTYQGPRFLKFESDQDVAKVSFVHSSIGTGLTTSDGQAPKHFYVAGKDKIFHKATAKIVDNQVWITSDNVQNPVAVRYAFTNAPITNFSNKEELPAVPFRTDNWKL